MLRLLSENRREYCERLQGVRERGDVDGWLRCFCVAVRRQAEDAVARAERLVALRERYVQQAAGSRGSLVTLATLLIQSRASRSVGCRRPRA